MNKQMQGIATAAAAKRKYARSPSISPATNFNISPIPKV
jgi:hypothetical protein